MSCLIGLHRLISSMELLKSADVYDEFIVLLLASCVFLDLWLSLMLILVAVFVIQLHHVR